MAKKNIRHINDRRALRTRMTLRDAIISLMTERNWIDISVQDICERANVGRSTFYSHYANKEELLVGGLDDLRLGLQKQSKHAASAIDSHSSQSKFGFVPGLIQHAHEQRALFRALIGRHSGYAVQQRFREMLIRLIVDELYQAEYVIPRQALARFLAGGYMELLAWWVEQRAPLPIDRVVEAFDRLTSSIVNLHNR